MSGTGPADVFVSVLALIEDDGAWLPAFVAEAHQRLTEQYSNFEILLIDNGSPGSATKAVQQQLSRFKCVRYLRLSRKIPAETAITAGMDSAIGDFVVTLDPQGDPLGEMVAMIELCRSNQDIVLGLDRSPPPAGLIYRFLRATFVWLSRLLLNVQILVGTTTYRVFSRAAVNALTRIRTRRRYLTVLAAEIGLNTAIYPYDRRPTAGSYDVRSVPSAVRVGLSVLLHYSILPLRLVSLTGLVGSAMSLGYSVYVVIVYLIKPDVAAGWTTLSLQVSGLFLLVFMMLALLGECVGRLMEEGLDRPLYHIRDEQSSAVMLADIGKRNVIQDKTE